VQQIKVSTRQLSYQQTRFQFGITHVVTNLSKMSGS